MRFTLLPTLFLLPSLILAAPAPLSPRATDPCAPTLYTLSSYTLTTSPSNASVAFTFQSSFASTTNISDAVTAGATCSATGSTLPNTNISDAVTAGATCSATGSTLPNTNECDVPDRKLLFDLRSAQDGARYQITHTWTCDGNTYMSGNDVTVDGLVCDVLGDVRSCHADGPQSIEPQNVRRICDAPRC